MLPRREFVKFAAALASPGPPASYLAPYKYNKLVLAADPTPGSFDSRLVDCPFVFRHNSEFYMTYLGHDGTGYQTGLASSRDLVNWRRLGCILKRDAASPIARYNIAMNWILRDSQLHAPGKLKQVRGHYLGVFHAYPNAGYEQGPAVIGLCWSRNLRDWELGDVVLNPEQGADWERGGLYKPCLLEEKGTYYLFYNAKTEGRPWHEQTGVATSTDLKQWTRHAGNPVLRNGPSGSPDERFASDPCVVLDGKRWLVFHFGLDAKGVARDLIAAGDDPFHLQQSHEILIDVGPTGAVDSTYAHKPSVIYDKGILYHFYCAVSGKGKQEVRGISVARSKPW